MPQGASMTDTISLDEAVRQRFADIDSRGLRELWANDGRAVWVAARLRDGLIKDGVPSAELYAVAMSRTEIEKSKLRDRGALIHRAQDRSSSRQIALSTRSFGSEPKIKNALADLKRLRHKISFKVKSMDLLLTTKPV